MPGPCASCWTRPDCNPATWRRSAPTARPSGTAPTWAIPCN
ncbi:Uncharacterised protein [Bordetella pertussis]|nr:Uncharacterised protein [Bordetella pertussis]